MIPAWQPRPDPRTGHDDLPRRHGEPPAEAPAGAPGGPRHAPGPLVRPFLVTGGRTHPLREGLRIETLISAAPAALYAPLRFEFRSIVVWCQEPRSVAEVASRLRLPLGVTRVLVGDLLADNLVTLEQPSEIPIDVIERIRDRVRAL